MHMITVSVFCNSCLMKIPPFNDFKKGFVNRIREKFKKKNLRKALIFGGYGLFWVGR